MLTKGAILVEKLILHQSRLASVLLLALRRYELALLLLRSTLCKSLHQGAENQTHRVGADVAYCCIGVCQGELTVSRVEWIEPGSRLAA